MASAPGMLTRTHVVRGRFAVGHFKNVSITAWLVRGDAESVRGVIAFSDLLQRAYPRFSALHVVEANSGIPTQDGREAFADAARASGDKLACVGVLLPHSAVTATLMKAFVRTVRMLVRSQVEALVEHDASALMPSFVAAHERGTGVRIAVNELADAVATVRALASQ